MTTQHRPHREVISYKIDAQKGRWMLMRNGLFVLSTPDAALSFAYDKRHGTVHMHGSTMAVVSWAQNTRAKLNILREYNMAKDLHILTVHAHLPNGNIIPGTKYISAEEANTIISEPGHILKVICGLDARKDISWAPPQPIVTESVEVN